MERFVMPAGPAPVHDLIRLREPAALTAHAPVPAWVEPALRRAPWAVVRRGYVRDGLLPVGVRGSARHERFAGLVSATEVAGRLSPEELIAPGYLTERARRAAPALAALARVAPVLAHRGLRGGPGGSVGFELATGAATATPSSDLDLILRRERRLEPGEAADLLAALTGAAASVRIDVVLETPHGGVSLAELAAGPKHVLVRTPDGVRLSADPWGGGATLEGRA